MFTALQYILLAPNIGLSLLKACEAKLPLSVLILNDISFLKRGKNSIGNKDYVSYTEKEYMIFKLIYFTSLSFAVPNKFYSQLIDFYNKSKKCLDNVLHDYYQVFYTL